MKLFRKAKEEDENFKELMETKSHLVEIHEKVAKEINSTHLAIDNRRKLAKAILTYGDNVISKRTEDTEILGECLGKIAVLETVVGDFSTRLNQALEVKVDKPINEFIRSEISAAEKEKKLADKAKAAFEAADAKMNNLKGRGDAKAFEAEKERNMLHERYLQAKKQADTAITDAIEKNKFNIMDHLCDYIDLYYEFFKSGTSAIEQLQANVDAYRSAAQKKRQDYKLRTGGPVPDKNGDGDDDGEEEEDIILEGWLSRQAKLNWKKEWGVVKYKYLYCYNNPEEKSLREVIPLVRCSVDRAKKKKNCFAINGKIDSHFFQVSTESEVERWMSAISSAIEEVEIHETRETGKVEIQGTSEISDDESDDDFEDQDLDPRRRLLYRLLKDERRYVKRLGRASKLYFVPLHADPRLKALVSPVELDVIFGHGRLKAIELLHADILEQLEGAEMASISAIFLSKTADFERLYIPYLSKLGGSMFQLNSIVDRSRTIKKFLKELEERLGSGNELATLLALPIQRFADYIKFFEDMMKLVEQTPAERRQGRKNSYIGDDPVLKDVIEVMGNLQKQINEGSAFSLNLQKLMNLRRQLENFEANLVDPRRVFIREGPLNIQKPSLPATPTPPGVPKPVEKTTKMTACHAFLFNDLLVFTKPSGKKYNVITSIDLHKTRIVDPSEYAQAKKKTKDYEVAFRLEESQRGKHSQGNVIKLKANSLQDKVNWLCDIDTALLEIEKTRKVYGVSLDMLMNNREKGRDIPLILEKAVNWIIKNGLDKQGIFRLSGNATTIEVYKEKVNQGQEVEFPDTEDPYVVAGMIGNFFMDLPEPLLTKALHPQYVSALDNGADTIGILRDTVLQLPMHNRFVLQHLISFFQLVVAQQGENKMGPPNLAIVFGATLLGSSSGPTMLADFANNQKIVEILINNYDEIFSEIETERKEFNLRRLAEKEEQEAEEDKKRRRISQRVSAIRQSTALPTPPGGGSGLRKSLPLPPGQQPPPSEGGDARKLPPAPPPKLLRSGDSAAASPKRLPPVPGGGGGEGGGGGGGVLGKSLPVPPRPKLPTPGSSPYSSSENLHALRGSAEIPKGDVSATIGVTPTMPSMASPPAAGKILKEGWLMKKGGNRRNWQTRWFVLKSPELSYYKNKKDAKPKGVILLGGAKVKSSNHKQYCFGVSLHDRTYLMVAKDEKEKEDWMEAIIECQKYI